MVGGYTEGAEIAPFPPRAAAVSGLFAGGCDPVCLAQTLEPKPANNVPAPAPAPAPAVVQMVLVSYWCVRVCECGGGGGANIRNRPHGFPV